VLPEGREGVDPHAADHGRELHVLRAVEAANDAQKHVVAEKVVARFGEDLRGRRFALWGLAFKRTPTTCARRRAGW
jgi:UDPglucose 6-dehydrogenase